ncbi:ParB-like nuclease domain-containing protein [Nostoc sp. CENA67]|uniref:ParB-like nuclease domain-containing protein n=1 Tax=Amazonocrinis nigriterrae CENA67 TaxID=2794033 RepID=A0A8J7HWU1_9NOST|nr:ParB N-terminal domain-containing protein [Amazonocrinis nigriterrae]MBH8566692.1 ParB-like nuclease domain-containing protein [Amazonocrinis nigriterrae CENA67]
MPQTIEAAITNNIRGDLRPINPTDIRVSEDTVADIKEVERIIQVLKNKGSLPEIIVTQDNALISGINALEAAIQFGQSVILATVQRRNNKSAKLHLATIKLDGGTQSRAGINQQIVDEYAAAWRDEVIFPPIIVFYDGENYWLADGFHRCLSAKQARLTEIDADIRQGTRRDAVLFSVGANSNHGLRRTNEDKRRAVMTLLQDDEWKQWSDREIARRTGVHHDTVGRLRAELSGGIRQIEAGGAGEQGRKVSRNGSTYSQKSRSSRSSTSSATKAAQKPWLPKETEVVEITRGKFKGNHAEVRVISGNMAMCHLIGSDENERENILLSDMKPIETAEQDSATSVTSVAQETAQKQAELGLGKGEQVLPDQERNEGFDTSDNQQQAATVVNLSTTADAWIAEAAIALMRLSPEQLNQAIIKASPSWDKAHIEAAYQALHQCGSKAA